MSCTCNLSLIRLYLQTSSTETAKKETLGKKKPTAVQMETVVGTMPYGDEDRIPNKPVVITESMASPNRPVRTRTKSHVRSLLATSHDWSTTSTAAAPTNVKAPTNVQKMVALANANKLGSGASRKVGVDLGTNVEDDDTRSTTAKVDCKALVCPQLAKAKAKQQSEIKNKQWKPNWAASAVCDKAEQRCRPFCARTVAKLNTGTTLEAICGLEGGGGETEPTEKEIEDLIARTTKIVDDEDKGVSTPCCKTCTGGKACGNSCISQDKTCTKPKGCACDAKVIDVKAAAKTTSKCSKTACMMCNPPKSPKGAPNLAFFEKNCNSVGCTWAAGKCGATPTTVKKPTTTTTTATTTTTITPKSTAHACRRPSSAIGCRDPSTCAMERWRIVVGVNASELDFNALYGWKLRLWRRPQGSNVQLSSPSASVPSSSSSSSSPSSNSSSDSTSDDAVEHERDGKPIMGPATPIGKARCEPCATLLNATSPSSPKKKGSSVCDMPRPRAPVVWQVPDSVDGCVTNCLAINWDAPRGKHTPEKHAVVEYRIIYRCSSCANEIDQVEHVIRLGGEHPRYVAEADTLREEEHSLWQGMTANRELVTSSQMASVKRVKRDLFLKPLGVRPGFEDADDTNGRMAQSRDVSRADVKQLRRFCHPLCGGKARVVGGDEGKVVGRYMAMVNEDIIAGEQYEARVEAVDVSEVMLPSSLFSLPVTVSGDGLYTPKESKSDVAPMILQGNKHTHPHLAACRDMCVIVRFSPLLFDNVTSPDAAATAKAMISQSTPSGKISTLDAARIKLSTRAKNARASLSRRSVRYVVSITPRRALGALGNYLLGGGETQVVTWEGHIRDRYEMYLRRQAARNADDDDDEKEGKDRKGNGKKEAKGTKRPFTMDVVIPGVPGRTYTASIQGINAAGAGPSTQAKCNPRHCFTVCDEAADNALMTTPGGRVEPRVAPRHVSMTQPAIGTIFFPIATPDDTPFFTSLMTRGAAAATAGCREMYANEDRDAPLAQSCSECEGTCLLVSWDCPESAHHDGEDGSNSDDIDDGDDNAERWMRPSFDSGDDASHHCDIPPQRYKVQWHTAPFSTDSSKVESDDKGGVGGNTSTRMNANEVQTHSVVLKEPVGGWHQGTTCRYLIKNVPQGHGVQVQVAAADDVGTSPWTDVNNMTCGGRYTARVAKRFTHAVVNVCESLQIMTDNAVRDAQRRVETCAERDGTPTNNILNLFTTKAIKGLASHNASTEDMGSVIGVGQKQLARKGGPTLQKVPPISIATLARANPFLASEKVKAWVTAVITSAEPLPTNISSTGATTAERETCDREAAGLQDRVYRRRQVLESAYFDARCHLSRYERALEDAIRLQKTCDEWVTRTWGDAFRGIGVKGGDEAKGLAKEAASLLKSGAKGDGNLAEMERAAELFGLCVKSGGAFSKGSQEAYKARLEARKSRRTNCHTFDNSSFAQDMGKAVFGEWVCASRSWTVWWTSAGADEFAKGEEAYDKGEWPVATENFKKATREAKKAKAAAAAKVAAKAAAKVSAAGSEAAGNESATTSSLLELSQAHGRSRRRRRANMGARAAVEPARLPREQEFETAGSCAKTFQSGGSAEFESGGSASQEQFIVPVAAGVARPQPIAGMIIAWQPQEGQVLPSAEPTWTRTCTVDHDCRGCYQDAAGGRRCQDWGASCVDSGSGGECFYSGMTRHMAPKKCEGNCLYVCWPHTPVQAPLAPVRHVITYIVHIFAINPSAIGETKSEQFEVEAVTAATALLPVPSANNRPGQLAKGMCAMISGGFIDETRHYYAKVEPRNLAGGPATFKEQSGKSGVMTAQAARVGSAAGSTKDGKSTAPNGATGSGQRSECGLDPECVDVSVDRSDTDGGGKEGDSTIADAPPSVLNSCAVEKNNHGQWPAPGSAERCERISAGVLVSGLVRNPFSRCHTLVSRTLVTSQRAGLVPAALVDVIEGGLDEPTFPALFTKSVQFLPISVKTNGGKGKSVVVGFKIKFDRLKASQAVSHYTVAVKAESACYDMGDSTLTASYCYLWKSRSSKCHKEASYEIAAVASSPNDLSASTETAVTHMSGVCVAQKWFVTFQAINARGSTETTRMLVKDVSNSNGGNTTLIVNNADADLDPPEPSAAKPCAQSVGELTASGLRKVCVHVSYDAKLLPYDAKLLPKNYKNNPLSVKLQRHVKYKSTAETSWGRSVRFTSDPKNVDGECKYLSLVEGRIQMECKVPVERSGVNVRIDMRAVRGPYTSEWVKGSAYIPVGQAQNQNAGTACSAASDIKSKECVSHVCEHHVCQDIGLGDGYRCLRHDQCSSGRCHLEGAGTFSYAQHVCLSRVGGLVGGHACRQDDECTSKVCKAAGSGANKAVSGGTNKAASSGANKRCLATDVMDGGTCENHRQCRSHRCESEEVTVTCSGSCQCLSRKGEGLPNAFCKYSKDCKSGSCKASRCSEVGRINGATCEMNGNCLSGVCNRLTGDPLGVFTTHQCVPKRSSADEGAWCSEDAQCVTERCIFTTTGKHTMGRCTTGRRGEKCGKHVHCLGDLKCAGTGTLSSSSGVCALVKTSKSPTYNQQCYHDDECLNSKGKASKMLCCKGVCKKGSTVCRFASFKEVLGDSGSPLVAAAASGGARKAKGEARRRRRQKGA